MPNLREGFINVFFTYYCFLLSHNIINSNINYTYNNKSRILDIVC